MKAFAKTLISSLFFPRESITLLHEESLDKTITLTDFYKKGFNTGLLQFNTFNTFKLK